MFGRTGLPTTTARRWTDAGAFCRVGNAQATAVTRGASRRLARPMTAFCSCISVRRPWLIAAISAGSEG